VLEVLIGLALVFLLLSLVCSTVQEAFASWLNWRGAMLRQAIARLLSEEASDAKTAELTNRIYNHALIDSLRRGERDPSYIPNESFADALIGLLTHRPGEALALTSDDRLVRVIRSVENAGGPLAHMPQKLRDALSMLLARARAASNESASESARTLEAFRREICQWYENTMNRATGWYRRKTQLWQFCIALVVVAVTNADTLMIADQLAHDPEARAALVASATKIADERANALAADVAEAKATPGADVAAAKKAYDEATAALDKSMTEFKAEMNAAQVEVGWPDPRWRNPNSSEAKLEAWQMWSRKLLGLAISVCAVALGAPFWFQMLEKLVKLRGSGNRLVGGESADANAPTATTQPLALAASGPGGGEVAIATAVTTASTTAAESPVDEEKLDDPYWRAVGERWASSTPAAMLNGSGPERSRRTALFAARLAALAYEARWTIQARLEALGFDVSDDKLRFFDRNGTQAFALRFEDTLFVAYRGTEVSAIEDLLTDAKFALKSRSAYSGRVHDGFSVAIEHVWSDIEQWSKSQGELKRVVLTGHSLGAALATLHYARIAGAKFELALYTFGSPRVGDAKFCDALDPERRNDSRAPLDCRLIRFVNNRDLVTRVAPRSFDFDHLGAEIYIDAQGRVHDTATGRSKWQDFLLLVLDAAAEFKAAAKKPIRDHSMALYVRRLENWTDWKA